MAIFLPSVVIVYCWRVSKSARRLALAGFPLTCLMCHLKLSATNRPMQTHKKKFIHLHDVAFREIRQSRIFMAKKTKHLQ